MHAPLPGHTGSGKTEPTQAELEADGASFMALMAQQQKG